MFLDPTSDLIQQLTRIADAVNRPGPPVWADWAKTLANFPLGILGAFVGIWLKAAWDDHREKGKMRRVVYTELTNSVIWLFDLAKGLPKAGKTKIRKSPEGKITMETHPPFFRVLNTAFTFEGDEFMKQHHSTAYELPEMAELKRMYVELGRWTRGYEVARGEVEGRLVRFAKLFQGDANVRKGFVKFSGSGRSTIEAIANRYVEHKVKPGDLMIAIETLDEGDDTE